MTNRLKHTATLILITTLITSFNTHATNGDNLIGLGATSRAMGGTGIAHFSGAASALKNPALLAKQEGVEVMFGGTYFSPDVDITTRGTQGGANDLNATSDADTNVIPEVAIAHALDNDLVLGVGIFGSAGMGTDWRDSAPMVDPATGQVGLYSMRSNLLLLKFALPIAYGKDNWSVGIAPVLQYGALDLAFETANTDPFGTLLNPPVKQVGRGSSYDFGLGYELGFAYDLKKQGITLGAVYVTSIAMTYDHQISNSAAAFGYGATPSSLANFSDDLEQPAEFGVGISWSKDDLSLTADYRNIRWGDANGYKDFGWENQNVYAIGAEYRMDKLALRFGYNYGKNPIKNNTDATGVVSGSIPAGATEPTNGDVVNAFNHVIFPAITERHYTAGLGYTFSNRVSVDLAFTYATSPNVTVGANTTGLGNITVSNDQTAITAGIKYNF